MIKVGDGPVGHFEHRPASYAHEALASDFRKKLFTVRFFLR
jgi:hypothetical protein